MSVTIVLLVVNAIVHAIVVARFGLRGNNEPFLVFTVVDALLAGAVYLLVPYAIWAVLVLSTLGFVGLNVTFSRPARDKTLDRVIWLLDATTILFAVYRLFAV